MASKTYKCFTCGAELKWSPAAQCWQCEYCDSKFNEEDFKDTTTVEQDNDTVETQPNSEATHNGKVSTYKCSYCGAELVTDSETAATFCVYCRRPVVLENNLSGEFQPDMVLPFKKTKEDAQNAFKQFMKGKRFLPNDFKKEDNIKELTGIYIPFWLADASLDFTVQGEGDEVTRWSDSEYRYKKTDTFYFTRNGTISFINVPADASKKADDKIMDSIEPFDFSEMVPFKMPYLSGFLANKYDVNLDEALPKIINRCENTTDGKVNATLSSYESVRKSVSDMNIIDYTSKYVLLPVWMLNTQYKDKIYTFAMNGQSGKLIGNLPISPFKVIKFALLTFLCSSIASMIVFYLGGIK